MRLARTAVVAIVAGLLAACDETPAAAPTASVEDPNAALKNAARSECAEVTNYLPDKLATMTPEMRALTEREYNLCVSKVSGGR